MTNFLLEIQKGIATLTINRPARLNALTVETMDELQALCRQIERSDEIHVVVLTGQGRAFCAGGDIDAWSQEPSEGFARHWLRDGHLALDALARLRQPVIAALNGHVLGGGLELAVCADFRIAEKHIKIGLPEPSLGVIPGWSGTQRTARRFGVQIVRRMAMFGEVYGAEHAERLGLVDKVVPTGESLSSAVELAESLRHRGPVATELVKMMLNAAEGEERERVLDSLAGRVAASQPELKTGLAAFRAREKPDFWK